MEKLSLSVEALVYEANEIGSGIEAALNGEKMFKGCSKRGEVVKRREIAYELELIGGSEAVKAAQTIRAQNRLFIKKMEAY